MKQALAPILSVLLLLIGIEISYAEVNIDLSGSNVEIQNPTLLKIRNLVVPGYPGKYWVDFQWNPTSFVFIPVKAGVEAISSPPQQTALPLVSKTWSYDVNYSSDASKGTYTTTLTTDPNRRALTISFRGKEGRVYCGYLGILFVQGNKTFEVDTREIEGAALFTPEGWSGWQQFLVGQTAKATISNIPLWFNFSTQFVIYEQSKESYVLEPDGTVHR